VYLVRLSVAVELLVDDPQHDERSNCKRAIQRIVLCIGDGRSCAVGLAARVIDDGESAGWLRHGALRRDRVEEGRGSTGQGAGESQCAAMCSRDNRK
jgi:hypothetical protein